jgi:ribosomal protein S18 acetylase RimI-like enzyme
MLPFETVEQNLRHTMQIFARGRDKGEVRQMPGVLIACAGVESPVFNSALLSEPVTGGQVELDRRIAIAKVYYTARDLRWSFWVCEDMLSADARKDAGKVFAARGMEVVAQSPGMIAERVLPPSRWMPALECRRVSNAEASLAFCYITSKTFHLSFEISKQIYNTERMWSSDMVAYVGYLGDAPIATAATVTSAGAVGIYSVATLPEYQRRGFGERIVRHALEEAQRTTGIERSVLQSTRAGLRLYQRMGYQHVTRVTVYVSL